MTSLIQPIRVDLGRPADIGASFEAMVRPVLEELRGALAAVLEGTRPAVRRARELQRALKLDNHLSWSIFNAAHAQDALDLPSILPGERAVGKFLERAGESGVSGEVLGRARRAWEEFERIVEMHAEGREMFEAMVAGLRLDQQDVQAETDLKNKRAAFRAISLLWGCQARQVVNCSMYAPSHTGGLMDRALINGTVGYRQTRPGVAHQLEPVVRVAQTPDVSAPNSMMEPLESSESDDGPVGLLRKFCSQPLPEFRAAGDDYGNVRLTRVANQLGATDETTYFIGHVSRAYDTPPGIPPGNEAGTVFLTTIPLELYVYDVLMHESLWDERLPEVSVYSATSHFWECPHNARLPLREKAVYLGRGVEAARSPELPRHTEMIQYALDKLGWKGSEFRVFRCRVEYPVISSRIRVIFKR